MRGRRRVGFVLAMVVFGTTLAGGVVAATQSSDEAALQPSRGAASRDVERRIDKLMKKMTLQDKLNQIQLISDGQINEDPTWADKPVGGVFSLVDPVKINEYQNRAMSLAAAHPDPVRLRHDPRLPHDLPDPARRRQRVRPERRLAGPQVRRARVGRGRPQADLQPDGRRLARAALGPHLRGRRRGSVPQLRLRGRAREGRPGPRLLQARQGRHQRQALRRLRPAGGRARLQHDRHVGAAAARPLPAAVQGGDRRGRRHRDVLVQLDQRQPRLREP